MPASTRSSNKDADFKVYYAKKAPKQRHFPHRRKTVRRPKNQHGADKKQMTFVPEKMRMNPTIKDSDEEDTEEELEEELVSGGISITPKHELTVRPTRRATSVHKGKKRRSDVMEEDSEDESEPVSHRLKRRRKSTASGKRMAPESDDEQTTSSSGSDQEADGKPRSRIQSTMTQIVDGRRPEHGSAEPSFRPQRKNPRTSWGSKGGRNKGKDGQQRTLTQMVPGLVPLATVSDEDAEEDSAGFEAEIFEPTPSSVTKAAEHKPVKSRFSLLSTPEKRRIFEIPSSQSPPESPLSTQNTPQKPTRTPLRERSSNAPKSAETPSKRKNVSFQQPIAERRHPPSLRKFASVIQDSENEDEDVVDDTERTIQDSKIRAEAPPGVDIGEETQAMLISIDQVCAQAAQSTAYQHRDSSEELGEPVVDRKGFVSPEPGNQQDAIVDDRCAATPQPSHFKVSYLDVKREPSADIDINALPIQSSPPARQPLPLSKSEDIPCDSPNGGSHSASTLQDPLKRDESDVEDRMSIGNDSSDEEEAPVHIPPRRRPSSPKATPKYHFDVQEFAAPIIQIPRSPSANPETQQSHSSKAEQQLQAEYLSYSQYQSGPPLSSMQVAPESGLSYQATPFAALRAPTQQQVSEQLSQATTVDPTQLSPRTTPRKTRSQPVTSANTTPRRASNSQPFISPPRPPPLFIPSSSPSPSKSRVDDWSSPLMGQKDIGYSQLGESASIVDFSIPAPPPFGPAEDEDGDDEEEL